MNTYKRNIYGFTLVEMLTVIALIGILAALLMPGLKRSVENVRKAVCSNNMKQAGVCTFLFANDNNGLMPLVNFTTKVNGYEDVLFAPDDKLGATIRRWCHNNPSNTFNSYWQEIRMAQCPSHPRYNEFLGYINNGEDISRLTNTYILTRKHASEHTASAGQVRSRINDPKNPSKLFMWLEREDYSGGGVNSVGDAWFRHTGSAYSLEAMGFHHDNYNGFNAAFFDGHVSFFIIDHQPFSHDEPPLILDNWN